MTMMAILLVFLVSYLVCARAMEVDEGADLPQEHKLTTNVTVALAQKSSPQKQSDSVISASASTTDPAKASSSPSFLAKNEESTPPPPSTSATPRGHSEDALAEVRRAEIKVLLGMGSQSAEEKVWIGPETTARYVVEMIRLADEKRAASCERASATCSSPSAWLPEEDGELVDMTPGAPAKTLRDSDVLWTNFFPEQQGESATPLSGSAVAEVLLVRKLSMRKLLENWLWTFGSASSDHSSSLVFEKVKTYEEGLNHHSTDVFKATPRAAAWREELLGTSAALSCCSSSSSRPTSSSCARAAGHDTDCPSALLEPLVYFEDQAETALLHGPSLAVGVELGLIPYNMLMHPMEPPATLTGRLAGKKPRRRVEFPFVFDVAGAGAPAAAASVSEAVSVAGELQKQDATQRGPTAASEHLQDDEEHVHEEQEVVKPRQGGRDTDTGTTRTTGAPSESNHAPELTGLLSHLSIFDTTSTAGQKAFAAAAAAGGTRELLAARASRLNAGVCPTFVRRLFRVLAWMDGASLYEEHLHPLRNFRRDVMVTHTGRRHRGDDFNASRRPVDADEVGLAFSELAREALAGTPDLATGASKMGSSEEADVGEEAAEKAKKSDGLPSSPYECIVSSDTSVTRAGRALSDQAHAQARRAAAARTKSTSQDQGYHQEGTPRGVGGGAPARASPDQQQPPDQTASDATSTTKNATAQDPWAQVLYNVWSQREVLARERLVFECKPKMSRMTVASFETTYRRFEITLSMDQVVVDVDGGAPMNTPETDVLGPGELAVDLLFGGLTFEYQRGMETGVLHISKRNGNSGA